MIQLSIGIKTLSDVAGLSSCRRREVFTPEEISGSSSLTLAGKFAAKQAFLKSLGISPPFYPLYKHIEIKNTPLNRPFIETRDRTLLDKLKGRKISVSISHTKEIAVAACLLYGSKEG